MHRFLNAVYWWCIQRVKPDESEEWHMMLEAPLPGQKNKPPAQRPAPWSEEEEAESFMAMMATMKE